MPKTLGRKRASLRRAAMITASAVAVVAMADTAMAHPPSSAPWDEAASQRDEPVRGETLYTLTNLHPDEQRARLYAVNYLQEGLIPRCTRVEVLDVGRKAMRFRVQKSQKEYTYFYHKAAAEDFEQHLDRYFGKQCPAGALLGLSETELDAIDLGEVRKGMSRDAVILAIGYPPRHRTPDLDVRVWRYWKSRLNTIAVRFDRHGRVQQVID